MPDATTQLTAAATPAPAAGAASASAAKPSSGGGNWLNTALEGIIPGLGVAEGASQLAAVVDGFVKALTDGTMWRSLAWIFLGVMLIIFSLVLLARKSIEGAIGTVAGAAAKAP
jgi:hypothetical protein